MFKRRPTRDPRPAGRDMDLTRATAQELGSALDRVGVTRATMMTVISATVSDRISRQERMLSFTSSTPSKGDFSLRGQFLNGSAIPQGNGTTLWKVPLDSTMSQQRRRRRSSPCTSCPDLAVSGSRSMRRSSHSISRVRCTSN